MRCYGKPGFYSEVADQSYILCDFYRSREPCRVWVRQIITIETLAGSGAKQIDAGRLRDLTIMLGVNHAGIAPYPFRENKTQRFASPKNEMRACERPTKIRLVARKLPALRWSLF